MSTKPRAGSMSDADRVLVGHHRRTPLSVPIVGPVEAVPVNIDAEMTPPPQEPPTPDSIEGYENLSPPARAQFNALSAQVAELTHWLSRRPQMNPDQFARIDDKLAVLATSATRSETMIGDAIVPRLNELSVLVDTVAHQLPRVIDGLEATTRMIGVLDTRLHNLEIELRGVVERFTVNMQVLGARVTATEQIGNAQDVRITALELERRDRDTTALVRSQEDRKSNGKAGGLVGGVVGAIIAAVVAAAK